MNDIRSILLATDFSAFAERALEGAILLSKTFQAPVHVMHAFDVRLPLVTPYEVAVPHAYLEEARQAAKTRLDSAAEKLRDAGIEVHVHLAEVPAASAIARLAEELQTDLIVMGTRGNTGLKHVLLGSVAERTLRLAHCSVLTVKGSPD